MNYTRQHYKDEQNIAILILSQKFCDRINKNPYLTTSVIFAVNNLKGPIKINKFQKLSEKIKKEIMQKIILLVEPINNPFYTPEKIGNIFMNRFAIDENASIEILNIFELGKTSMKDSVPEGKNFQNILKERQRKGTDYFKV